jgi:hypothetical protein
VLLQQQLQDGACTLLSIILLLYSSARWFVFLVSASFGGTKLTLAPPTTGYKDLHSSG